MRRCAVLFVGYKQIKKGFRKRSEIQCLSYTRSLDLLNWGKHRSMCRLPSNLEEIMRAKRIAQVLPNTQENDIGLKMTPFERAQLCHNMFSYILTHLLI